MPVSTRGAVRGGGVGVGNVMIYLEFAPGLLAQVLLPLVTSPCIDRDSSLNLDLFWSHDTVGARPLAALSHDAEAPHTHTCSL